MRILILGGTGEAREVLAGLLASARHVVVYSLAGRTESPIELNLPEPARQLRVGGFGGAEGLAAFLRSEGIGAVVDATHPFATRISGNARLACAAAGVPLVACGRPDWSPGAGDDWTTVADHAGAVAALGARPRRVFLTVGRLALAAYAAAPAHHYLIRTIDRPDTAELPPRHDLILARGPFAVADEVELMRTHAIDVLVTKNSGGEATRAKLDAARQLGLPVFMIGRAAGQSSAAVSPGQVLDLLGRM